MWYFVTTQLVLRPTGNVHGKFIAKSRQTKCKYIAHHRIDGVGKDSVRRTHRTTNKFLVWEFFIFFVASYCHYWLVFVIRVCTAGTTFGHGHDNNLFRPQLGHLRHALNCSADIEALTPADLRIAVWRMSSSLLVLLFRILFGVKKTGF